MTISVPAVRLDEELLSLSAAARLFPPMRGNRPVAPQTVWRWYRDGIKLPNGVLKLAALRIGGRLLTSKQAVERFITAQNSTETVPDNSVSADTGRHERAEAELRNLGV